jgi:hypothetical protein
MIKTTIILGIFEGGMYLNRYYSGINQQTIQLFCNKKQPHINKLFVLLPAENH